MAQPVPYVRTFAFATYAANNPAAPYQPAALDGQLDNVSASIDGLIDNIALIQADDGGLANGVVDPDSLSVATLNLIGDWNPRGPWVTLTNYAVRDLVSVGTVAYVCAVAHFSGTFNTDLAAGYWNIVSGGAAAPVAASAVSFVPYGAIVATNVQDAIEELEDEKASTLSPTITTPTINGGTIAGAAVTSGSINGTQIGNVTPASGAFTGLSAVGSTVSGNSSVLGSFYVAQDVQIDGGVLTEREVSASFFGAIGDYDPDTFAGADDTIAIQQAMDYVAASGGGTVVLDPDKRYQLLGAAQSITVTITGGNTITASSGAPFTTMGLAAGDVFQMTGLANAANMYAYRAKTVTGTVLTVENTPLVNEGPVAVIVTRPLVVPANVTLTARRAPTSGFPTRMWSSGNVQMPYLATTGFDPSTESIASVYTGYTLDAGADTVGVVANGFSANDVVVVEPGLDGSVVGGGLTEGLRYFVVNPATDTIQLALTAGGLPVNISAVAPGANPRLFKIVTNSPIGERFRDMGGSLWVRFSAGVGNGSGTYNTSDVAGLPNYATRTAAILLRGRLDGLNVFQRSYDNGLPATYTDNATFNSTASSGNMSGTAIRQDADDAAVTNCLIAGFMQAVLSYNSSRLYMDNVLLDCMNGIELTSNYDTSMIRRLHTFPFSTVGFGGGSLVRRGTLFWFHDTVHWPKISNVLSYGMRTGIYTFGDVIGVQMSNVAFDNTSAETAGFYAVRASTNTQDTAISNLMCANREFGVVVDASSGNLVTVSGLITQGVNTSVSVASGNTAILGGALDSPGSGTRVGISNAGAGFVTTVGVTFSSDIATLYSGAVTKMDALGLTLSGTSQRVVADWSNATRAMRAQFQTNTANSTNIGAIPGSGSTGSSYVAYSDTDPDNAHLMSIGATSTAAFIASGQSGTGTLRQLEMRIAGVTKTAVRTTGVFGYANAAAGTGTGGTVTQGSGSGKATTVVLDKVCGEITTDNATLNAATAVSFTFTNSTLTATDSIICTHVSGGTVGAYTILGYGTGAGSGTITIRNNTGGNLSEALVIRFQVHGSVNT